MPELPDDTIVHVYALEFDRLGSVGLVYVGMTWGKKSPGARLEQHLRRVTSEGRRYLPPTNDELRFAGIISSHRFNDWPDAEADILRSYEAAGWSAPQVNKNCRWPMEHTPETRARLSAALRGKRHSPEHVSRVATANTGRKHSPEARARMSAAHNGKPGHAHTSESRAKISETKKGKPGHPHTPDARAKMSVAHRGRVPPNKGKTMSSEQRRSISAALTGRTLTPEHRANISIAKRGTNRRTYGHASA